MEFSDFCCIMMSSSSFYFVASSASAAAGRGGADSDVGCSEYPPAHRGARAFGTVDAMRSSPARRAVGDKRDYDLGGGKPLHALGGGERRWCARRLGSDRGVSETISPLPRRAVVRSARARNPRRPRVPGDPRLPRPAPPSARVAPRADPPRRSPPTPQVPPRAPARGLTRGPGSPGAHPSGSRERRSAAPRDERRRVRPRPRAPRPSPPGRAKKVVSSTGAPRTAVTSPAYSVGAAFDPMGPGDRRPATGRGRASPGSRSRGRVCWTPPGARVRTRRT